MLIKTIEKVLPVIASATLKVKQALKSIEENVEQVGKNCGYFKKIS